MVTKGIYLFWDKKYEQVIYAGRFTSRKRIKDHFQASIKQKQKINEYVQNHPDRIESVIFCEFDDISDEDLNQLEIETIRLFKLNRYKYSDSHVFNFTDGGQGYIPSEETRKKISENHADCRGKNNPNYGNPSNWSPSQEHKSKISDANSGKKNPNAKYTLWDITKCTYNKNIMFRNDRGGMSSYRCFSCKYNGKELYIGNHLDFYTPELINDLINDFLEVN